MSHSRMLCLQALLSCTLAITGCRVGPRYHQPVVNTPLQWKGVQPTEDSPLVCCTPLSEWWKIFEDAALDDVEAQAVRNNPDLFSTMAHLAEGWALAGVKRSDLFPQVDLAPSFNQTNELFRIFLPNNFNFPFIQQDFSKPFRIHLYQCNLPVNVRYEFDLWGKYRHQYDSAFRSAQAREEAYQTALLSLTSDVASSYFHIRTLDALAELLHKTIEVREKGLELARSRFTSGLVNSADVDSAQLELCNTQANLQEVIRLRTVQENLLATLMGIPASEFRMHTLSYSPHIPVIPAGLPSSILRRRPDVAEAERNMAAQHAEIGVAYAEFFPAFELTSALGFFSPTFQDFLTWQSRLFSYTIGAFQTLFDAGRRRHRVKAAWAKFAEASGRYQQQVLTAFKEVEDALANLEFQKKQSDSLGCSVQSANQLTQISRNRYQAGAINYIEVVNNERSALDAQRAYITVLGERYQSTIQLIKALGGGWDPVTQPCHTACLIPNDDEKTTPLPIK